MVLKIFGIFSLRYIFSVDFYSYVEYSNVKNLIKANRTEKAGRKVTDLSLILG